MVQAAQDRQRPDYAAAVNRFVAGYWRPVFYFLRTKGYPLQQAEDLTQQFLLQFLERDWMVRADRQRGRFRTFLLTILIRFLSDQGPRRAPKQKQFDQRMVPVSALMREDDRQFQPPVNAAPQDVFMQQWARALLDAVLHQLSYWCHAQGRPDWYEVFTAIHFPPPGRERLAQQAVADKLQITRDQVRYGLETANRQFSELLRAEVAEQVGSDADIEEEIRDIQRLLET
jgi:RNA polymerase sigma-70 factor (ECF subfamily)